MPLDPLIQQQVLNWLLVGSNVTRPGGRFLSFATGSPNQTGGSDGPYSPRQTATFAAANSPQGSATNNAAFSNTATAIATALGWNLYESNAAGRRIAYGTMAASVGAASGDTMAFAVGALKITLT